MASFITIVFLAIVWVPTGDIHLQTQAFKTTAECETMKQEFTVDMKKLTRNNGSPVLYRAECLAEYSGGSKT